jgi:hypothetical protein
MRVSAFREFRKFCGGNIDGWLTNDTNNERAAKKMSRQVKSKIERGRK